LACFGDLLALPPVVLAGVEHLQQGQQQVVAVVARLAHEQMRLTRVAGAHTTPNSMKPARGRKSCELPIDATPHRFAANCWERPCVRTMISRTEN